MKSLGLLGLLLLLTTVLSPAGHRRRHRVAGQRGALVQVIRSPWAAHAPKTVRRVGQ